MITVDVKSSVVLVPSRDKGKTLLRYGRLNDDIIDWIDQHPEEDIAWFFKDSTLEEMTFCFETVAAASLFKLTWA